MILLLYQHGVGQSTRVSIIPPDFDGLIVDIDHDASPGDLTDLLRWLDDPHALLQHVNLLLSPLSRLGESCQ